MLKFYHTKLQFFSKKSTQQAVNFNENQREKQVEFSIPIRLPRQSTLLVRKLFPIKNARHFSR